MRQLVVLRRSPPGAVATLRPVPRRVPYVAACSTIALSLALAACGQDSSSNLGQSPAIGRRANEPRAAQQLAFPQFATKNTTRVGGADPTADAAAVAQAVFTPELPSARPRAVALVDSGDWQAGGGGAGLVGR